MLIYDVKVKNKKKLWDNVIFFSLVYLIKMIRKCVIEIINIFIVIS